MPVTMTTRPMEFTRVARNNGKRAVNIPTDSDSDSDEDIEKDDRVVRVRDSMRAHQRANEREEKKSKRIENGGVDDCVSERDDDDIVDDAFELHRDYRSIGKTKMLKRFSNHSTYDSDGSDEPFVGRPASKMGSRPKSRKPSNVSVSSDHSMGSLGGSRSNSPMARRVSSSSDGSETYEENLGQSGLDSTFLSLFARGGTK